MFKASFKGYLVEIIALKDCLDNAKTALNVVLWPDCGRLCELFCELCNMSQKVFRDYLD